MPENAKEVELAAKTAIVTYVAASEAASIATAVGAAAFGAAATAVAAFALPVALFGRYWLEKKSREGT